MHLTVRGFTFIAAIALLFIAWLWNHAFGVPSRGLAGLFVILIFAEWLETRTSRCSVSWHPPDEGRLGVPLALSWTMTNPARGRKQLEYIHESTAALSHAQDTVQQTIEVGESITCTQRLLPLRLGPCTPGLLHAREAGRFGLARWPHRYHCSATIRIVPNMTAPLLFEAARSRQGGHVSPVRGTGMELASLREYQRGDPLRNIDWKASARSRKRIVRLMDEERQLDLFIMVDMGRFAGLDCNGMERLGHQVNVASRLAMHAIQQGDRVGVMAYAHRVEAVLPFTGNMSQLATIRNLLANLAPLPQATNHISAIVAAQPMLERRSLILFMTHLDYEDPEGQLLRSARHLSSKHLVLAASIADGTSQNLAERDAVRWQDPYVAVAAQQSDRMVQRNILALSASGCMVVNARPNQFESSLARAYRTIRTKRLVS